MRHRFLGSVATIALLAGVAWAQQPTQPESDTIHETVIAGNPRSTPVPIASIDSVSCAWLARMDGDLGIAFRAIEAETSGAGIDTTNDAPAHLLGTPRPH
jgi:hypothetical protein